MMEWLISSNQKTLWESNFLVWLRGEEIDAVAVFKVAWKFRILKITVAVQNFEDEGKNLLYATRDTKSLTLFLSVYLFFKRLS